MSICQSGIDCKPFAAKIDINITSKHPLLKLAQALPWQEMLDIILSDLKNTPAGKWWLGRKIKVRIHLGMYLLQQLFNKTDRQIEYDVNDNAAYQIFCGHDCVDKWHVPDHTKVEKFRSRLNPKTQQELANMVVKHAVRLGFGDCADIDIDSTIQEANMTYPSDVCLLKKLGHMANKTAKYLNAKLSEHVIAPLKVNMRDISAKARKCFFLSRKAPKEEKREKQLSLLEIVKTEITPVINACNALSEEFIKKARWNYTRTINQIRDLAEQYLDDANTFFMQGIALPTKRLSFHLKEVACFTKGKLGKRYQFGRAFQLGRINGNFMFVVKCDTVQMIDKITLPAIINTHETIFENAQLNSVATDKGYYSQRNEKLLLEKSVAEIGIQRPHNIKKAKVQEITPEQEEKLINRRSGIEPLIGHIKQGGQLGRSRMKNDRNIESSGYTAVLGFNMRQLIRKLKHEDRGKSMQIN